VHNVIGACLGRGVLRLVHFISIHAVTDPPPGRWLMSRPPLRWTGDGRPTTGRRRRANGRQWMRRRGGWRSRCSRRPGWCDHTTSGRRSSVASCSSWLAGLSFAL